MFVSVLCNTKASTHAPCDPTVQAVSSSTVHAVGRAAGKGHIRQRGTAPVEWLEAFARAANTAATGDPARPLLWAPHVQEPFWYRLHVDIPEAVGGTFSSTHASDVRFFVRCWLGGAVFPLPRRSTEAAWPDRTAQRVMWTRSCAFWPVQLDVGPVVLHLEVVSEHALQRGDVWFFRGKVTNPPPISPTPVPMSDSHTCDPSLHRFGL